MKSVLEGERTVTKRRPKKAWVIFMLPQHKGKGAGEKEDLAFCCSTALGYLHTGRWVLLETDTECYMHLDTYLSSSPGEPGPAISSGGCGVMPCSKQEPVLLHSLTTTLAAASTSNSATLLGKPFTWWRALKKFLAIPDANPSF